MIILCISLKKITEPKFTGESIWVEPRDIYESLAPQSYRNVSAWPYRSRPWMTVSETQPELHTMYGSMDGPNYE